jgi:hypothetical protein
MRNPLTKMRVRAPSWPLGEGVAPLSLMSPSKGGLESEQATRLELSIHPGLYLQTRRVPMWAGQLARALNIPLKTVV